MDGQGGSEVSRVRTNDPGVVFLQANPPQRIKILGLQDWKDWKIGNTARIVHNDWRIGSSGSSTPMGVVRITDEKAGPAAAAVLLACLTCEGGTPYSPDTCMTHSAAAAADTADADAAADAAAAVAVVVAAMLPSFFPTDKWGLTFLWRWGVSLLLGSADRDSVRVSVCPCVRLSVCPSSPLPFVICHLWP